MSKFFINRPIFAGVIAVLILFAGLLALKELPISQYPEITPPTVNVTASYPGANAETIAETVGVPIETAVNGVEGALYMSSTSSSSGTYKLTITFEVGTDIDMATILVQNRVNQATANLPTAVTRNGITVAKQSTNIVMFISIDSKDTNLNGLYLSNYARLNVADELSRVEGVGGVTIFGADEYSMRIWLKPDVLQIRGLSPADISNMLSSQNMQVAAGTVGQPPVATNNAYQYTLDVKSMLSSPEEFGNIVIQTLPDGSFLRLKDVADIELGEQTYSTIAQLHGKPVASIGIYQSPGSNALAVAERCKAKMEELSKYFPANVDWNITLDTTTFVKESVKEVYKTLIEAFVLVLLVIMLFLQNWRAALVPTLVIPVSLIGTFAVMSLLGFSLNTLTLFGLILAIGIVVDDAIVVVENTVRHLETGKFTPKEAAIKSMQEVSGPIVGIVLVLLAVFIPTAFIGGISGQLYKQFALTIAVSTVISGVNALTFSPALCALILRPNEKKSNFFLFRYFDKFFAKLTQGYARTIGFLLRKSAVTFILYIVLSAVAIFGFLKWPSSFIPNEDQGFFVAQLQLEDGASQHQTTQALNQVFAILDTTADVENYLSINGFSMFQGSAMSNYATLYIMLKPWEDRTDKSQSADAIVARFNKAAARITNASVQAFVPPPIAGLGNTGGFELMLQNNNNNSLADMQAMVENIVDAAPQTPGLMYLNSGFSASVPQKYLNIDRDKVKMQKLQIGDVFSTLSAYMASAYVNDFVKFGRVYKVMLESDNATRTNINNILNLTVKNADGKMVPFSSFTTIEDRLGSNVITRYNLYPSASIMGMGSIGTSSGQALDVMENLVNDKAGNTYAYQWTGTAFQEKAAGSSTSTIFLLAIFVVIMVLAAQYESLTSPFAVIMGLPIALLGVIIGCLIMGESLSVYSQIGIILLIGLAAKNAILIVEFARDYRKEGAAIRQAATEAGEVRFRPIIMTSLAFILGVYPLVVASGAGAVARISLGTAVFFGMLVSTILGTLFIPSYYEWWEKIQTRFSAKKHKDENHNQ